MIKLTVKTQGGETEAGGEEKVYNYEFEQPVITMGRLKENDIQIPLSTVSGYHAQIIQEGDNYYLLDRGSINGTFLNGQKLLAGERKLLQDGDTIRIQTFEMYFMSGVMVKADVGATVQVARQMVMELLGSWESQQEPRIIIMGGPDNGKQIELSEGKVVTAGRGSGCDIVIDHPTISRKHAELTFSWNGAYIKDLNSANGVYVNDLRISGTHKLRDRDEIRLGQQHNPEAIRFIFSNPTEALLSKIEEAQSTDSNPVISDVPAPPAEIPPPVEAPPAAPIEAPPAAEAAPAPAPVAEPVAEIATPVVAASEITQPRKKSRFKILGIVLGVFLLVGVFVVLGFLFVTSARNPIEAQAQPPKAAPGDLVTISGDGLNAANVQNVTVLGKAAEIIQRQQNQVVVKLPLFVNMEPGERSAGVTLEDDKGLVGHAKFTLVVTPEIKSINPTSGKSGTEVRIEMDWPSQSPEVYFGKTAAVVTAASGTQITAKVPEVSEQIPDAGQEQPVTVAINGVTSRNKMTFTLFPGPYVRSVVPDVGGVGADVHIRINGDATGATVYFGSTQATIKSILNDEIVATVPTPVESIPAGGMSVPILVRLNDVPIGSRIKFTLLAQSEAERTPFQLTFFPKPYSSSLGFNEYSIETNIGPFLVLVASDESPSSSTRAELVANRLNDMKDFFRQHPSAKVVSVKEEGNFALYAEGDVPEDRHLLIRVFPEDALAYGKINQRVISVDALTEWWRMLIDSYYKVFVQVQSPASTGILGVGGNILQQVYSFYPVKGFEGRKYFKKDFLDSLPADQKAKLLALNFAPPKKITGVDGKWTGTMSNVLYKNISEGDLALNLILRQRADSTISGSAEITWKLGVGANIIYKKLGEHTLSGNYDKTKSYPLEFSFVEKDGRRLDFVGKLEGDTLTGSFVVNTNGEEGSWNVRLRS